MKRRFIGIAAAIVLAAAGTAALVGYVQTAKDEAVADEARVQVYVLAKDVAADTPIAEIQKALDVVEVPKQVQAVDAVRDLEGLDDNLVAAVELRAGEQLLASRLVDKSETTKSAVPAGLQEVTIALDPERAVGGQIAVGDTVGVVLSFDPFDTDMIAVDPNAPIPAPAADDPSAIAATDAPTGEEQTSNEDTQTPNTTHLTFHKVAVTGVQFSEDDASDEASEEEDGEGVDTDAIEQAPRSRLLVTLALSSREVEQVVFAAEFGHIWLTAENAGADESGTRIVDLGVAYEATEVVR